MRSRSRSKQVRHGSGSSGRPRSPAPTARVAPRRQRARPRRSSRGSAERRRSAPAPAHESAWASADAAASPWPRHRRRPARRPAPASPVVGHASDGTDGVSHEPTSRRRAVDERIVAARVDGPSGRPAGSSVASIDRGQLRRRVPAQRPRRRRRRGLRRRSGGRARSSTAARTAATAARAATSGWSPTATWPRCWPSATIPHRRADDGVHGKGKDQHGRRGEDLEVTRARGHRRPRPRTPARCSPTCVHHGDRWLAAAGGRGGRGNAKFLANRRRAPTLRRAGRARRGALAASSSSS